MLHPFPPAARDLGPLIELKNVTCGYDGRVVLSNVNISIMPGDFVGLLGPSGSGKTTLLRAILGAVDIYGGEVCVAGVPVDSKRPRAGYVPQLETIDWNFPVTVEQVVMMGRTMEGGLFPWFKRSDRDAAHAIMERLGIGQVAKRPIRDLSGGQQRRVFLARALVSSPHLLLLDEPTSGADIKTRDEILHLLDELNHQNVTVVMSTHELNAVAAHLPWVVCVNGGVVAEGPPSEVFTPDILKATYNAEMPVVQYGGMTLVGERPHFIGRHSHTRRGSGVTPGEHG